MLEITDLRAGYGRIAAVRGISLTVADGEIVGLIGSNGAGKSTTLSTIAGVKSPASGSIVFDGAPIVGLAPERIVRRGISLVPEGRGVFGTLTVEENLLLGGTARKTRETQADLQLMFARFPILETYRNSPGAGLSGGEQQQLVIARALLARPKLLLLDEPWLGLAPLMVDRIFEILEELRGDGVTVLLVEQNARRTVELADRTYIMSRGEIALSGTREELLKIPSDQFEAEFLGLN